MVTSADIVKKYITFFKDRGHVQIANSPLVLQNDPTTLFTSSGMQALIPYLLGEIHPQGTKLVNVQNCIRTQDIEEVGDNRHTTFFRMIGNWSLGDYFKKEQLPWFFEFLTKEDNGLGLNPERLYVTVFGGDERFNVQHNNTKNNKMAPDLESVDIWKKLFEGKGIDAKVANIGNEEPNIENGRIFYYGVDKNWWSRSGSPDKMPPGEPGGPDSEVFFDFGDHLKTHENSIYKDQPCHPNCDCGRFMEIGNSVFMQYIKQEDGTFKELPKKNVDFGGGLERLLAATNDNPDVFYSDIYKPLLAELQVISGKKYNENPTLNKYFRIIADHITASTMLAANGVEPSNKQQGYILRRLLRRAIWYGRNYLLIREAFTEMLVKTAVSANKKIYVDLEKKEELITQVILAEENKFLKIIEKGTNEIPKKAKEYSRSKLVQTPQLSAIVDELELRATGDFLFKMYESYGFPPDLVKDVLEEQGWSLASNLETEFQKAKLKHQELSRTASSGMFRGGLADHQERTIMGHTATHLMHQALRDVLGSHVHQTGSNITTERIRFDFNYEDKLTDEQIKKVENIVNEKIEQNLPVHFEMIPTEEAKKMGAIGLFEDTYADTSKIYFIGDTKKSYKDAYSIEFCGGPHVEFTGKLKSFKIIKQENLGKGQKRLYSIVNS